MDVVSLSKESCRFIKQEKSLYLFILFILVKCASCNQTKARREKVYFEKEGPTI